MSLKETCVVSKFDGLFTAPVFLVHVKFCSMYQIIASTKAGRYQHSMFFGFRGPNFSAHYLTLGCNQRNLRRMRKHPTKNSDSSRNFPPLQAPSSPVSSRTFDQAPRRGFFKRVEGILSKKTTSSFGGCFFLSLRLKSFEVPFVFLEVGDISYDVCVSMCVLFFFFEVLSASTWGRWTPTVKKPVILPPSKHCLRPVWQIVGGRFPWLASEITPA